MVQQTALCLCPTEMLSEDLSPQITIWYKVVFSDNHGAPKTIFGGSLTSICV